ncbi:MAG: ATP-binding cassette domain-containing protein [Acutalibacteraceae bacterium]
MQPVLQLTNVSVSFETPYGEVEAVRDVSWSLNPGEVLAIVGESGCGKTVMVQSIMKLLPKNSKLSKGNCCRRTRYYALQRTENAKIEVMPFLWYLRSYVFLKSNDSYWQTDGGGHQTS